jgi:hypothetical protein
MVRATRPVSIDGIEFDALIDEDKTLENDVPTYPVESGFEVSDAIIQKPLMLNMKLFLTNTPVTWAGRHRPSPTRVKDVLARLERLYFRRTPVTVRTSDTTYTDMAIMSIALPKSKEFSTAREIPISFKKIRVVKARVTTIPASYGRSGSTGTNAGAASVSTSRVAGASTTQSDSSGGNSGSVIHGLASAVGLF